MAIPAIKLALISFGTLGTGTVAVGAPLVHFGVISLPGGKGGKGEASAKAPTPEARSEDAGGSSTENPSNPSNAPEQIDTQKQQVNTEEQPSKAVEEGTKVEQPQPLSSEVEVPSPAVGSVDSTKDPSTDGLPQESTLSPQGQVVDEGQTHQDTHETRGDSSEPAAGSPGTPEASVPGSSSEGVSTGDQSPKENEGGADALQGQASDVTTQGKETNPSEPAADNVQTGQESAGAGGSPNATNGAGGTVQETQ